jgi:hypothetical protein
LDDRARYSCATPHIRPFGRVTGHEAEAAISAVWITGLEPDAVAPDVVAAAREISAGLWGQVSTPLR